MYLATLNIGSKFLQYLNISFYHLLYHTALCHALHLLFAAFVDVSVAAFYISGSSSGLPIVPHTW